MLLRKSLAKENPLNEEDLEIFERLESDWRDNRMSEFHILEFRRIKSVLGTRAQVDRLAVDIEDICRGAPCNEMAAIQLDELLKSRMLANGDFTGLGRGLTELQRKVIGVLVQIDRLARIAPLCAYQRQRIRGGGPWGQAIEQLVARTGHGPEIRSPSLGVEANAAKEAKMQRGRQ